VIDARATGQSLTLTWTDGRGEVVRRTVKVGTGGHWATTFGLPPAARTHLGSVRVSYAGTSKLLPATVSRTVARQRRRGAG
jgi:hypothetical protein